jgi:hypothetical protein
MHFAIASRELGDEVAHEQGTSDNRARSGAMRWEYVEPIEEILAETSGANLLVNVPVGRRDDANIHADGPRRSTRSTVPS